MENVKNVTELDKEITNLCMVSLEARQNSYSPYSKFKVGAALLSSDGTVFTGCNVENASYPVSICAERTALVKAVSSGHQEFAAIAISADLGQEFVGPCGACRQNMAEFNPELPIYLVRLDKMVQVTSLGHLLPAAFTPKNMKFNFHDDNAV